MLIQFKVSNFCSIRDTQTLSMVADSGSELEENTFTTDNHDQLRLLRAVGIYGANAAGKSNILEALLFMHFLIVTWPNRSQVEEAIPIMPFMFDDVSIDKPSEFEISFIKDQVRYQYGVILKQERVLEEWLFAYPSGKPQKWFSRVYHNKKYEWKFSNYFKNNKQVSDLTRDNVLYLSTAINFNNEQLKPVFDWFHNEFRFINSSEHELFRSDTFAKYINNKKFKDSILSLVKIADDSIIDIFAEKNKSERDMDFLPNATLKYKDRYSKIFNETYKIIFVHQGKKHNAKFGFYQQSAGTQKLVRFVIPWLQMLEAGGLIIIDEMDNSLHPFLSRFLIELICNPKINKANAQLIFTTHDTTLLDNELLRRDQIWFVEKDEHHATHLYPLTEFSPRKQEAFGKAYLHGRYGAVPYIGEWKF